MNKVLGIIQARMSSTRLPGKVLQKVGGVPLLEYEIERVKRSRRIDQIVVATSVSSSDEEIVKLCENLDIDCFRGSEEDVLDRVARCAKQYPGYDVIVRITGDCPLVDPLLIDEVIEFFKQGGYDYVSNVDPPTFPDGMDVEVMKSAVLALAAREAKRKSEREHVTLYIRNSPEFKKGNFQGPMDFSRFRLTVDEPEDLEVIRQLVARTAVTDSFRRYVEILQNDPQLGAINAQIGRDEGLTKSLREDKKYD